MHVRRTLKPEQLLAAQTAEISKLLCGLWQLSVRLEREHDKTAIAFIDQVINEKELLLTEMVAGVFLAAPLEPARPPMVPV